jgi:uncharacterized lipoprotein YajG
MTRPTLRKKALIPIAGTGLFIADCQAATTTIANAIRVSCPT